MFLGSVGTFLFSKEFIVMEHEFFTGIAVFAFLGLLVKNAGPAFGEMIDKDIGDQVAKYSSVRNNELDR